MPVVLMQTSGCDLVEHCQLLIIVVAGSSMPYTSSWWVASLRTPSRLLLGACLSRYVERPFSQKPAALSEDPDFLDANNWKK